MILRKAVFALCVMVFALSIGGCADFDEPEILDTMRFLGCYSSSDASSIAIMAEGIQLPGIAEAIPYRVERSKRGAVLAINAIARERNGQLRFEPSEEHFYSFTMFSDPLQLNIAASPEAQIYEFRRNSETCAK